MRIRSIAMACAAFSLLPLSKSAMGQVFSPAGPITDTTQSLGQFSVVVNPAFAPALAGNPAYDAATNILTSPLLYDPTTQIDRSATTTVGSAAYTNGLTVGSPADGTVKASSITALPTGFTPTPGEDTVFTKINQFNLSGGGGFAVTAGSLAPGQPASVGEVVSNATGAGIGNPANDFPARSFFDIFVDISIPGFTDPLTNSTPLIVDNPAITSFPPVVIYTHGNSSAVPLMLGAGNPFGEPAGTVFGLVTLAGHGAGYGQQGSSTGTATDENTGKPADATDFEQSYGNDLGYDPTTDAPIPGAIPDLMPLPNAVYNTPGFGPSNEDTWSAYVTAETLPEPSSLTLLAVGVAAMVRRNRRTQVV